MWRSEEHRRQAIGLGQNATKWSTATGFAGVRENHGVVEDASENLQRVSMTEIGRALEQDGEDVAQSLVGYRIGSSSSSARKRR